MIEERRNTRYNNKIDILLLHSISNYQQLIINKNDNVPKHKYLPRR